MKKIHASIRVTELQTVIKTIISYYKSNAKLADDAFLAQIFSGLEPLQAQMTDSIHNDKLESNLAELDSVRDRLLSNLGTALDGYSVLPLPEIAEKARKVQAVFANYGKKIAAESFASESALLDGLLLDIQKEEIKACTKELAGIDLIIESLQAAQNDFSRSYAEFTAGSTNKGISATELKKQVMAIANNSLLPYLEGMYISQKDKYGDFAASTEAEIEKINSLVRARIGKNEKQKQ